QVNRHVASLVMEKVDAEKVAIGRALGLGDVWTILEWYDRSYGVRADSLYDALQNHPYYAGFHSPPHLLGYNHVPDEVPNSLVPLASLGASLGVPASSICRSVRRRPRWASAPRSTPATRSPRLTVGTTTCSRAASSRAGCSPRSSAAQEGTAEVRAARCTSAPRPRERWAQTGSSAAASRTPSASRSPRSGAGAAAARGRASGP